jgi:hypothetical protein
LSAIAFKHKSFLQKLEEKSENEELFELKTIFIVLRYLKFNGMHFEEVPALP